MNKLVLLQINNLSFKHMPKLVQIEQNSKLTLKICQRLSKILPNRVTLISQNYLAPICSFSELLNLNDFHYQKINDMAPIDI